MSRRFFIIIITVILIILLGALVWYYFALTSGESGTNSGGRGFSKFPFGQNPTSGGSTVSTSTPPVEPPKNLTNFDQKLREISTEPVAGAGLADFKAGTIVRHIEKATGHIYETELFSPVQNRISNTTLPQVIDGIWENSNNSLVARYLKNDDQTIDTYALTLKSTSTSSPQAVSAVLFPTNISDVSVFGNNIFYVQQGQDSSTGYVATFDGKNKRQVWSSPIREINPQFISARTVALTTKPEQNVPGFLYLLDISSGGLRSVLANIPGLSALVSPDTNQVLYLNQGDGATLQVLDQKTRDLHAVTPVTFPEKCVWSKKNISVVYCAVPEETLTGGSLISWYKGLISFTDDIWKIDLKANTGTIIESLSNDSGMQIDVIKPLLSEGEKYFVFINKRDGTLWSLDLTK